MTYTRTIVVPTDFSSTATNAAYYAAEMAQSIKANILLLHIYSLPIVFSELPLSMSDTEAVTAYEHALERLQQELLKQTNHTIKVNAELRMGTFFTELKAVCDYRKPYTVVMGSQGTSEVERMFFGSHTVYAMQHLASPVMTVPPGVTFSSIKKIGLACDFENVLDSTPVEDIKMLVNDFNAELHLLNTGKAEMFDPARIQEFGKLRQMLESLDLHFHYISNKNTDEALIDFAETRQLDLLLVLPKRHGLLDKLLHKSHTKQLVLHSHVPVMGLHQALN